MRNLIGKLFKRGDDHDYVLAEYEPKKKQYSVNSEHEVDLINDKDEMEIDNISSHK